MQLRDLDMVSRRCDACVCADGAVETHPPV